MKFTCDQQELTKALNVVSKAVSVRTTIPTLKGILINVTADGKLIMTASDMDITIENTLDASDTEAGIVVVQAKLFGDIVRKLPSGNIIFECEGENITIKCLNSEFTLIGMPADEFPNIKNTDEYATELIFDKDIFTTMIKKTAFAASIDQSKGVITGILTDITRDEIKMVAIDGFRMAIAKEKLKSDEEKTVIISARIMNEIVKIVTEANAEGDIRMMVDGKSAVVFVGSTKIIMRLIAGEFIRYDDILPKTAAVNVKVKRTDLAESVERASLLAKEGKNNLIKFSIKDNIINITSRSEEGNVKEEILAEKTGDDLDIGFNAKYILDILRVIDDEEIIMKFNTGISPCLIVPEKGDAYEYLILPVRITNM